MNTENDALLQCYTAAQFMVFACDELSADTKYFFGKTKTLSDKLTAEIVARHSKNLKTIWDIASKEDDELLRLVKEYDDVLKLLAQLGPQKIRLVKDVLTAAINNGIRYE